MIDDSKEEPRSFYGQKFTICILFSKGNGYSGPGQKSTK